jgi:glutamine---fructose-6-phosphate transaminase (isomerizing)
MGPSNPRFLANTSKRLEDLGLARSAVARGGLPAQFDFASTFGAEHRFPRTKRPAGRSVIYLHSVAGKFPLWAAAVTAQVAECPPDDCPTANAAHASVRKNEDSVLQRGSKLGDAMSNEMIDIFRGEVEEQPKRLNDLFAAYTTSAEIRAHMEALNKALPVALPVLWLGMGASFASSLAGATSLLMAGRASFVVEASEWLHYAGSVKLQTAAPILVTTSGVSAELVELTRRGGPRPLIVLCNQKDSPCWEAADIRFPILAGPERANATKTYVNSAAASIILASELTGREWQKEVAPVAEAFARSLETALGRRKEMEEFSRHAKNIEIIGRGPCFGGAIMGALCIRELTRMRTFAHSGGGFRHGPNLDVDRSHVAIIPALGRTADLGIRLAEECVQRGGSVILAGSGDLPKTSERMLCVALEQVPEPWEALTSVLVAQALTLALAEERGTDYIRIQTTSE